ncbi:ABC transporter substrate-binding protein [Cohnella suwonensis]|uniref:ABC transporter substrate-binding protein n=1 Tax=Cohnella suwonensis TaxID=696072 RepID=A0ABW0LZA7_9BACL
MINHSRQKALRMMLSACLTVILLVMAACGNNNNSNEPSPDKSASSSSSASPSQSEAPKEKVTLTFWNGFTGPDGELLKTIVDDYNKANSGKAEIKMDIMPWDQMNQKLPPSIATDTAPSFVAFIGGWATPYIKNGSFQDLSGFFEATGTDKSQFTNGSLDLAAVDGKPYLLPMQMNGLYLYWNKALFQAAGLDPEKPPASLEELGQFAVKLTDASKNQFGFGMPVSGAPNYFTSFIIGNGGDVVDLTNKKSVLNSPENVATFKWIQDLVANKKVSPKGAGGGDLDKLMQSGQLAMAINGPWLAPGLTGSGIDFGVAIPPKGTAKAYTELGGIGFAVPKGTSDEEKAAVYDFIKFWNTTEIGKKWSLANGFPPYLKSVAEDPEVKGNALVSAMANMGDAAAPFLPGLLGTDRINNNVLFKAIEAVQNGQSVEDVLKKASDDIDEILKAEQ